MSVSALLSRFFFLTAFWNKGVNRRRQRQMPQFWNLEQLELRVVPAAGANWSVVGSTLDISLMAGKTLTVTAAASSYSFVVSGPTTTDSNTWSTGTSTYLTFSGATATVNSSGKTNLTQINIQEVSGRSGVTVVFANSASSTYDTPIKVALGSSLAAGSLPGSVTFNGTTSFSSNKSLIVETTKQIIVSSGATVTTSNGNLTFKANVADTTAAGTTFAGAGIDIDSGTVQVTGTGILDLQGRGGDGSNTTPYGVYIRNNALVKGGTTGNQQIIGWGPTNSTNTKNYGVILLGSSPNYPTVTTNGGNLSVTGTARGAVASGSSDVSAGVIVDAGAVITAGGSGTVIVTGTGGANAGNGNVGVLVKGAGSSTQPSTITSGGGNVTVIGTGGGTGSSALNCGVCMLFAGIITSGGDGNVSVTGTGGDAPGPSNYGVYITGASSTLTSGGSGTVTVVGDGGGSKTSGQGYATGIYVSSGGTLTSGGSGKVKVTGRGNTRTASTGTSHYGVYVGGTSEGIGTITSGGGNVEIIGQGGGVTTSSISEGYGVFVYLGGIITSGGNGNLTVTGTGAANSGSRNFGVHINGFTTYNSARYISSIIAGGGGSVTVTGTGGSGSGSGSQNGVVLAGNAAVISSAGNGAVTVNGYGGTNSTADSNNGVELAGAEARISSGGSGTVTVSGTGGGSGASKNNYGLYLTTSATITSGTDGSVVVTGQGGTTSTGPSNVGIQGYNGYTITSGPGSGDVTVTAIGGGTGSSTNNHGIGYYLTNATPRLISAGGTGTVTVNGTGGNAGSSTGSSSNYGLHIAAGLTITSSGGDVIVNGTGGGNGSGNHGVYIMTTGLITAGGTGTVTVSGVAGVGSAGSVSHGIIVSGSSGDGITSGGGNVTINATEGIGKSSALNVSVGVNITGGSISTATNGGDLTLNTNSLKITAANQLQTKATNSLTIQPRTSGVGFNLGSTTDIPGGPISLSSVELGYISTGTLNLGNSSTGPITVSAAVTIPSAADLNLATANTSAGLTPSNTSGTGITMGSGKSLGLTNIPSVNIAIDGSTLGVGYKQLSVDNAAVTLTGKQLVLSGSYTPLAGEVFTIVSAPTGITGTFNGLADGDTLTFNGRSLVINYTATAVTLSDPAPVVTSNPSDQGVITGNVVTFSAAASGIPTPTVRWQVDSGSGFVDITPAETSTSLSFTANISQNGYQYRAVFTNSSGEATTNAAVMSVYKKSTSTTLTSSANPSNYGDSVTFTANVTNNATGTVTFKNGSTTLGTATLTSGTATFTTSDLAVGSHSITAIYNGAVDFDTSTSSELTQVVNSSGTSSSTTTLVSSANPSTYGDSVTFTATVTSGATGSVTFKDGSTTLGTATLSSGTATFTTASLGAGVHSITAVYEGNTNFSSSTSNPVIQTVDQAPTTTTLVSSANPSTSGDSVTFTATVTSGATGTVTFRNGTTTLGTGTISAGTASFTTSSLNVGSHTISAVYDGDTNFVTSTSSDLTQVVKASTTTTLTSSANPSTFGASVTFTATVTSGATGSVTFKDGSTTLGTATLSSGTATFTVAGLTGGTHTITAFYEGSPGHASSLSNSVQQIVTAAPVVTGSPTSQSASVGSTATFTAAATGYPEPTVQWQISTNGGISWSNIAAATSSTYTTAAVTSANDGTYYRAVYTNSAGSDASTAALLRVNQAPTVTQHPTDVSTTSGSTATFSATASGWTAPAVQWQINTGSGWSDITGATGSTYTTPALAAGDSGNQYRAVFTNSLGSATTNPATLTTANLATITNFAVGWGSQIANLVDVGSGRLLPTGRTKTISWLGIRQITLTLDQSITSLTTADVTLLSGGGFSYGVASVTGAGMIWTITLSGAGLINADRVMVGIGGNSVATTNRRLDVLPGDANDDGIVTSLDQLIVSKQISSIYNPLYDIDGNGILNSIDVSLIKARLGRWLR